MRSREQRPRCGSRRRRPPSPCRISVGAAIALDAGRARRSAAPAAACADHASSGCAVALAVREDPLDELGAADPARARSRRTRAGSLRSGISSTRSARGIGNDSAPPGVVQASTSLSTRSGCASASSCATIPPRLVPTTCARSTPGLVEHLERVGGHLAQPCTDPAARRSRRCRGCRRGCTSNERASGSTTGSQPQRA